MPSVAFQRSPRSGTRHKAFAVSRVPDNIAVLSFPLKIWNEWGLNTPVQPRFANGMSPSRLFARSRSGKMNASIYISAIDKKPRPIAVRTP